MWNEAKVVNPPAKYYSEHNFYSVKNRNMSTLHLIYATRGAGGVSSAVSVLVENGDGAPLPHPSPIIRSCNRGNETKNANG